MTTELLIKGMTNPDLILDPKDFLVECNSLAKAVALFSIAIAIC
ncbi:hypothetical protein [Kamptonema sp. UHCC 0994]|nr:hypothetical protein [Kamptonema sp. UHCC 0994]MDF0553270.1 hypothetical protein [Kamptonema sp. UHCC 0994]